jgi:hypothetical protein
MAMNIAAHAHFAKRGMIGLLCSQWTAVSTVESAARKAIHFNT